MAALNMGVPLFTEPVTVDLTGTSTGVGGGSAKKSASTASAQTNKTFAPYAVAKIMLPLVSWI